MRNGMNDVGCGLPCSMIPTNGSPSFENPMNEWRRFDPVLVRRLLGRDWFALMSRG